MKLSAFSSGFLCLSMLLCICLPGLAYAPDDWTPGIEPAELVDIALDGKEPAEIFLLAWNALTEQVDVAGPLDTFTKALSVMYHEEGLEPTLDVSFRRNEEAYSVSISIGIFDILNCVTH